MAGSLHVRNVDDELIARLKRRAARHGRSAEAEHREILSQALSADAEPSFDQLAAELRKLLAGRKHTPSRAPHPPGSRQAVSDFVIDASIAIKWLVPEEGSIAAIALRGGHLAAPDLLAMECANALWRKVTRKEIRPEEATVAAGILELLDIELVPMRQLVRRSVELAIEFNHPVYDCAYMALSAIKGWPFVTADASLLRKVPPARAKAQGFLMLSMPDAAAIARDS